MCVLSTSQLLIESLQVPRRLIKTAFKSFKELLLIMVKIFSDEKISNVGCHQQKN